MFGRDSPRWPPCSLSGAAPSSPFPCAVRDRQTILSNTFFFAPAPPARTAANRRPAPPTEEAVLFIYCSRAGVKLFLAASPSGFRLAGSSAKGARPRAQGTGPIQRPSCHCEAENVDLAILRLGMRYCAIRRLTNAGRRSPSKTPSTTPRRARIRRSPTRRCGGTRGCRCRVRASCVPRP